MRSSVFFRRTLALVLSGVILASLLSAVLYIFIARNLFVSIRGDELTLVGRSIASFIASDDDERALETGFIFKAIANENTNFVDATVYALNADGILKVYSSGKSPDFPNRPEGLFGPPHKNDSTDTTSDAYTIDKDAAIVGSESNAEPSPTPSPAVSGETSAPDAETSPPPDDPASRSADKRKDEIGKHITTSIIADTFESVKAGGELITTAVSDEDSKEYLIVGVPIYADDGSFDGAVIITKPVDELSGRLQGLNITLVISAILTCLIMVIPAYIAGKKLTNPIRDIQGVAQAMSVGDFSVRADEHQAGEIGELAVAINEFAEKSEKLEQTRRDYVANISHELRTPIASIRAMSETLRDGLITDDDEKKQRYYDHILRESMRLTRLVDDLLELSRLQSRGVALKCENTDLLPVLDASAATFEQTAADSGIDFKFDRPDVLPMTFTNADRIQQILVILLDNAIKHTPDEGSVTLAVDVEAELLKISVTDNGEGISEEDMPHVFERFYKSDKSRSGSGTGLGLSIAREVLAMMNETISVESQLGKGSRFTFTVHLAME